MEIARNTVLVVEDEGLVRLDAVESLRAAGFQVVEAGSADEALRAFEAREDIDLVFTDIDIPGAMDGLELARFLHQRRPQVRLILTSGTVRPAAHEIPEAGEFLRKPYCTQVVASTIRRLLA
jgi:CheY-like chemotaxis protein